MQQREMDFIADDLWKLELEFRKDPKNAHDVKVEQELFKELNALGYDFHWRMQFDPSIFSEKDKAIVPIIIKYADKFENKGFKEHYLSCLGVKGFYDATEYLLKEYEKGLQGCDHLLLDITSQTIAKIQNPKYINEYINLLKSENVIFEDIYIIEMLGKMKVEKAIPSLINLLDGENKIKDSFYGTTIETDKYAISQESIRALGRFRNPEHIKYIEKFLEPEKISWIKYPDTKEGRASLKRTYREYMKIAQSAIERMSGTIKA